VYLPSTTWTWFLSADKTCESKNIDRKTELTTHPLEFQTCKITIGIIWIWKLLTDSIFDRADTLKRGILLVRKHVEENENCTNLLRRTKESENEFRSEVTDFVIGKEWTAAKVTSIYSLTRWITHSAMVTNRRWHILTKEPVVIFIR
jgi:hypothetical protein